MKDSLPPYEELEVQLTAHLLGELGEEEARAVEQALDADVELKKLYDELKGSIQLFEEMAKTDGLSADLPASAPKQLSEGRRESFLVSLRQNETDATLSKHPGSSSIPWFIPMGIAAGLILLLSFYGFFFQLGAPAHSARAMMHFQEEYVAADTTTANGRSLGRPSSSSERPLSELSRLDIDRSFSVRVPEERFKREEPDVEFDASEDRPEQESVMSIDAKSRFESLAKKPLTTEPQVRAVNRAKKSAAAPTPERPDLLATEGITLGVPLDAIQLKSADAGVVLEDGVDTPAPTAQPRQAGHLFAQPNRPNLSMPSGETEPSLPRLDVMENRFDDSAGNQVAQSNISGGTTRFGLAEVEQIQDRLARTEKQPEALYFRNGAAQTWSFVEPEPETAAVDFYGGYVMESQAQASELAGINEALQSDAYGFAADGFQDGRGGNVNGNVSGFGRVGGGGMAGGGGGGGGGGGFGGGFGGAAGSRFGSDLDAWGGLGGGDPIALKRNASQSTHFFDVPDVDGDDALNLSVQLGDEMSIAQNVKSFQKDVSKGIVKSQPAPDSTQVFRRQTQYFNQNWSRGSEPLDRNLASDFVANGGDASGPSAGTGVTVLSGIQLEDREESPVTEEAEARLRGRQQLREETLELQQIEGKLANGPMLGKSVTATRGLELSDQSRPVQVERFRGERFRALGSVENKQSGTTDLITELEILEEDPRSTWEEAGQEMRDFGDQSLLAKRKSMVETPRPAAHVEHQPEQQASQEAVSTFSLNVSDVSFKVAEAALNQGQMPAPESIRSEQFLNAFNYRDPAPFSNQPIGFNWEQARHPFAHHRDVIRLALQTAATGRDQERPLHLTILLDNSGSMERSDRQEILRQALEVLSQQMTPEDKISVVSFARTARLWVDGAAGGSPEPLLKQVRNLTPQGGTNLGEALDVAYQVAGNHYRQDGINRVVLLTDGAANLGNVDPEILKQKVETERRRGIAFDCFGVGWDGLNDPLLETLSRNGDGRYAFLNDPTVAGQEFANRLAGALNVAAADVKVQVEFNADRVGNWRQIGYARHQLTKEPFRDNTGDAAEIAAAESGNALYIIEPKENGSGPIGVVRVRYREPHTTRYHEKEWTVPYRSHIPGAQESSPSMKLAMTSAFFAEWLNGNPHAGSISLDGLQDLVRGTPAAFGQDPRPHTLERMLEQAKSASGL